MPESFEAFLLTCRTLHDCAKPLVPLYKSRRAAYSTLEVDARTDRRGILLCLDRIAQNPDVARYATTANLSFVATTTKACRPSRALRQTTPFLEFDRLKDDHEALCDIEMLIERSPCLRAAGIDTNAWGRQMLDPIFDVPQDQCDCSFESIQSQVFILSMLKNIRTLRIEVGRTLAATAEPNGPQAAVLAAIKAAQAQNPFDAPLGQLKTLLSFPPVDYDTWKHFEAMRLFLTIPTLTEVYASSFLALEGRSQTIFSWPQAMPVHHNLRRIELAASCFDDIGLAPLLAGTPALETFKFGYAIKHHGQGYDYNPAEMFETLREHVGGHLKHLAMTLEPHFFGTIVNGVVDLHGFTSLESLEIDYRMFYGPSIESGERNGSTDPTLPKDGRGAIWTPSNIPPLTEILPPQLQKLEVFLGESPSAGSGDRFDQDASLRALFSIPDIDDLSSLTTSSVEASPATATAAAREGPFASLPAASCTIRCVNRTLTAERPGDVFDLRQGWTKPDQIRTYLEAGGVTVHVNSPEDPTWVCEMKERFKIETW
ncbi:uncharacterized protein B0I36DRAFT_329097 [Microdochium trichocladiopsis]|uniref:Uncharacterized protein n=1 Tax=Microdochium trichocladiopsis TaxID=1682393 RepID=A0A9P8Y0H6_9PEZI|nr:uncharacterized protein B0I36DRAFT_329097 [Microdochium trichocladiopsis]KAH7025771.1 hypothetical protein B0I36DRAFT_329097 [Microdochium trichocladiopsis]